MKKIPSYQDLARAKTALQTPEIEHPNHVRKSQCESCPFRPYGEGIGSNEMTKQKYYEQQARLTAENLSNSSQYCHEPLFNGKRQKLICRGARDRQIQYFHAIGVLKEKTDECWKQTLLEAKE